MSNHEQEPNLEQVNFMEVERVHASKGAFSIYQVNARDPELIDLIIFDLKARGVIVDYPEAFETSLTLPFFEHEAIEYDGSEELPTVIYLTGPTPDRMK